MPDNPDYPYIRAWGRMIGAEGQFIDRLVAKARDEGAPPHAVYRNLDGQWQTTDDVILPASRFALGLDPLPLRPVDAAHLLGQLQMAIAAGGALTYLYGLDTIQPLPDNTGLRLTFATGYTAELRLSVQEPNGTTSGN